MKKKNKPKQRLRILQEVFTSAHNLTKNPYIVEFLETYIDCETTAHKIVRFYRRDKYARQDASVILDVRKVVNAAGYFGLPMDESRLRALFTGGKGIRGKKTPRQIRNGYLHEKSAPDAIELKRRYTFLQELMQEWLSAVKAFMADLADKGNKGS